MDSAMIDIEPYWDYHKYGLSADMRKENKIITY